MKSLLNIKKATTISTDFVRSVSDKNIEDASLKWINTLNYHIKTNFTRIRIRTNNVNKPNQSEDIEKRSKFLKSLDNITFSCNTCLLFLKLQ